MQNHILLIWWKNVIIMLYNIHQILTSIHVPAGFIALLFFWLPALSRKGKKLHVLSGKVYYISMWIVLGTAALLSLNNFFLGNYSSAIFLGFLTVITSYPLWYSRAILKQKANVSLRYFKIRKYINLSSASLSILLLSLVFVFRLGSTSIIIAFFGILGLSSIKEARQTYQIVNELSRNRIFEHLKGTIITGIAAHTAFFAFGGRRFFEDILIGYWQTIPWILPTIIGVAVIKMLKRKYVKTKPQKSNTVVRTQNSEEIILGTEF